MSLLPKRLTAWRRRGHATVAAEIGFLSPEERKQLAKLKGEGGRGHRGSRLASDEDLGPASFKRPE